METDCNQVNVELQVTSGSPGMAEAVKIHQWISRWLTERDNCRRQTAGSLGPLLIGISGPQGSGKTTLTRNLVTLISASPRPGGGGPPRSALAISLDDFYKTRAELVALQSAHPTNPLLHGRGLPGTHDLELMLATLQKLHSRNPADYPVHVPVYDKAAFNGQGDRSATEQQTVAAPLDVILLEGWMLGFTPPDVDGANLHQLVSHDLLTKYGRDNLTYVTRHELTPYGAVDALLDHFIHWTPQDVRIVYEWRVQQEQELRAKRGGKGMNDEQVRQFVDRYMPVYELCVPKLTHNRLWGSTQSGQKPGSVHLKVQLRDERVVEKMTVVE